MKIKHKGGEKDKKKFSRERNYVHESSQVTFPFPNLDYWTQVRIEMIKGRYLITLRDLKEL